MAKFQRKCQKVVWSEGFKLTTVKLKENPNITKKTHNTVFLKDVFKLNVTVSKPKTFKLNKY